MTPAKDIFQAARQFGVCSMLQGTETPDRLMRLFFTPQGIEFCQKHNFPDIATLRSFRGADAVGHGLHIDAGRIVLENEARVALIGDTVAELRYDDPSKRHEVILMHGAKAHITASGYSVVFVTSGDCEVTAVAKDMAKIL